MRTGKATRKTVVVAGHGMVGHRFVQELRDRDLAETHNVVVLSEEPVAAYDRVGLSGYVGAWDPAAMALPGNDYAGDDLVDLRLGQAAVAIDPAAKTVITSTGDRIEYSTLVLATGYRSDRGIWQEISGAFPEAYLVGDALRPANVQHAVWSAYEVARQL